MYIIFWFGLLVCIIFSQWQDPSNHQHCLCPTTRINFGWWIRCCCFCVLCFNPCVSCCCHGIWYYYQYLVCVASFWLLLCYIWCCHHLRIGLCSILLYHHSHIYICNSGAILIGCFFVQILWLWILVYPKYIQTLVDGGDTGLCSTCAIYPQMGRKKIVFCGWIWNPCTFEWQGDVLTTTTLPQKRGHAQTAQTVSYEWMYNSCTFEWQGGVLETLWRKLGQDQTIPKTMFWKGL